MGAIDSSGAVDGGRIRRAAANIVRQRDLEYAELISVLQAQFEIPENRVREELNKCFEAGLLYKSEESDDAEVTSP